MSFRFHHHTFFFRKPAVTSRDVLRNRDVYFLIAHAEDHEAIGIGECAPIWGLSPESKPEIERTISNWQSILSSPDQLTSALGRISSLRFGLESAMRDLASGGRMMPFEVDLTRKIPINGLVWMSDAESMLEECRLKVESGYTTIKFKVGALDFEDELRLLRRVRQEFSHIDLDIRLDANGAFTPSQALEKLDALSSFRIHSIEQPLKAGNPEEMARLVEKTPIAIALDEELIGVHSRESKVLLLDAIRPHYLVLKPTLHGSFTGCDEWIDLAQARSIGWWATSALESNVGLNAIAQWVLTKKFDLPQGLGTGGLFTNNIESPWIAEAGMLRFEASLNWNLKPLLK